MYDLRDLVSIGGKAKVSHQVRESDTVGNYTKGLEELCGMPAVISLAMQASVEAIDKYLPDGFVSVCRKIEFEHKATTMKGGIITVEATVTEVQPLMILVEVVAADQLSEIGRGVLYRSIVNRESLLRRAENRKQQLLNVR